jgi:hypothetical protein
MVALREATQDALAEVGKVAVETMEGYAEPPTGGDRRFSRFYPQIAELNATASVWQGGVSILASGAWALAEDGAAPHQASAWGRGRFAHPGTAGSQGVKAWTRGSEAVFQRVGASLPEKVGSAVERAAGAA